MAKRITMNISERVYNEANELDSYLSMGYQNVLKTAMTIGLTELFFTRSLFYRYLPNKTFQLCYRTSIIFKIISNCVS